MVKGKVLKYDVITKKEEITEEDIPEPLNTPPEPLDKGLDFKKLKQILKQKGIIKDFSEVEPSDNDNKANKEVD